VDVIFFHLPLARNPPEKREILSAVLGGDKIPNPKREIRNKFKIQNQNVQDGRLMEFWIWVIRISFVIRHWSFGFQGGALPSRLSLEHPPWKQRTWNVD
jgi:hypothetical protein